MFLFMILPYFGHYVIVPYWFCSPYFIAWNYGKPFCVLVFAKCYSINIFFIFIIIVGIDIEDGKKIDELDLT